MQIAGHGVRAEGGDVHADLPVAVLHPVAVDRVEAVVGVRLREVRVHPRVRPGRPVPAVQPGCGLPNTWDSAWVLIRNGWSGKSRRTTAVRYLFWLRRAGRVVELRIAVRHRVEVRVRQLRLVDPVLRVDRLEQRVVLHVGRDVGGRRRRERRAQHERREHGHRPDARAVPHRGHLHLALPPPAPCRRRGSIPPQSPHRAREPYRSGYRRASAVERSQRVAADVGFARGERDHAVPAL